MTSAIQLSLPIEDAGLDHDDAARRVLKDDLLRELGHLGSIEPADGKAAIRERHRGQRLARWHRDLGMIGNRLPDLVANFANGADVDPGTIEPELVAVEAGTPEADLFRLATLLWSVPVSQGYGRRMRFLIRDHSNASLIGIFALGDPVFNLRARDQWIGWATADRRERLVNVMDAFVVGAVPPYSLLLGGKLVFSLIASAEVGAAFTARYGSSTGIISGKKKAPRLVLVTVTSALGRSALYNRLRLADPVDSTRRLVDLVPIGWTRGYGHFQVSDGLFARMRAMLAAAGHPYAAGHRYGDGPNWRMRVTRVALQELGLSPELQRHGIEREVFAVPLASNAREFLTGRDACAELSRPSAAEISEAALARWVRPRAARMPAFRAFRRSDLLRDIKLGDHHEDAAWHA
jgi:Druantia protein DruA